METSRLKRFAPECRINLIKQVEVKLDYVLTAQTPDLAAQEKLINQLREMLETEGRDALVERIAYTWFNRFAAFRYLDARGWHPFRKRLITSTTEGDVLPELLQEVKKGVIPDELRDHVPGERINDLLDGKLPSANPQAEVQRLLVIGVSQYYADLLPGLFAKIDAFSGLLLPDDLLTATSVAEGFRTEITDDDCSEVEILGWLYQFYISEKKDAVMARKKAVPSEDIPAVTQLFTPHWIVRYLVENSLGRLWLRSRPHSRLKEHMPYYVEDPEGQAPADSLTVATPEEIRLLDPACGSGHMLTYAFDLLVKIYEEEGHAPSEIPEKILTHNLFGLEICPRAAQLAQFALVCKAREQSRTAFRRPVQPQVMCLRDVVLTPEDMQAWSAATGVKLSQDELAQIHQFRENTETFGALIQPVLDGKKLAALVAKIGEQAPAGDLLVQNTHRKIRLVLDQAEMLSQRYQVVVANPPYMGSKFFNSSTKKFVQEKFGGGRTDLYACFISRNLTLAQHGGFVSMITLPGWLFLTSFDELRQKVTGECAIITLIDNGRGLWGSDFGSCAFTILNQPSPETKGSFKRLYRRSGEVNSNAKLAAAFGDDEAFVWHRVPSAEFRAISGAPIAFWLSDSFRACFGACKPLGKYAEPRKGMVTADNPRFIRNWNEVSFVRIGFGTSSRAEAAISGKKWFPYQKGGDFRRWYGNQSSIVDWEDDGKRLLGMKDEGYKVGSTNHNLDYIFSPAVVWTKVTISEPSFRYSPKGFLFDDASGLCVSKSSVPNMVILSFLCSRPGVACLKTINPTVNTGPGNLAILPLTENVDQDEAKKVSRACVNSYNADWDNFETSWDFRDLPLLRSGDWEVEPAQPGGPWKGRTLAESWDHYATYCNAAIRRMQELETANNRLWIDAYSLQDELTSEVPEDEITLARADQRKDVAAFLSYAVGCMMGRYSLDAEGLILADAGDTLEEYWRVVGEKNPGVASFQSSVFSEEALTFVPDDDAIIPITEDDWFEDDAASRVREFLRVTFGAETLEQNIAFIEESLGKDLRKYFTANTGGFYADHVKTYKKRPIYWMFESPKKHFRALVYLHRYTKDTVNTLLNGYLREFRHKLTHRRDELQGKIASDTATGADRKALDKTNAAIKDVEDYERDILLPLAQQRLEIDLDDGVKTNYPKFGKALAKVTGL